MISKIPLTEIFDIFKETDNSNTPNLTEESIYKYSRYFSNYQGKIPVFSGATLNDGVVGFIPKFIDDTFFKEDNIRTTEKGVNFYKNKNEGCITIVGDGKAGFMFLRTSEKYPFFCMNISSLAMFKKDDNSIKGKYREYDGLIIEWFYMKYFDLFQNIVNRNGVSHFTKEIYSEILLDIPSISEQNKELKIYIPLFKKREKLINLLTDIEKLEKLHISQESAEIENDLFFNIFNPIEKGSQGFTSYALYNSVPNILEEKIPFWGGEKNHIKENKFVSITAKNKDGKEVKIFNKDECIIISMDGSAGTMTFKKNKKFTLNHHAGVLTLKDIYKNKISLERFSYKYEQILMDLSVSSGSKTLSNKQLEILMIDFYKNIQTQLLELKSYKELNNIKNNIENIIFEISKLFSKIIIY